MKLSGRAWLSVVTIALIVIILFATRHELLQAWRLLSQVNLWILALVIPVILLNYYAAGETVFSYLRSKGRIKDISVLTQMRISLELNFVNHALPSGGASGISYMTWRLKKLGVPAGKAAMAQGVRLVAGVMAFIVLLILAVLMITVDGEINRWIILVSSTLVGLMLLAVGAGVYLFSNERRAQKFGEWGTRKINLLLYRLTKGRKRVLLRKEKVAEFIEEMSEDYRDIKAEKQLLKLPFLWSIVFLCTDVAIFFITFWALGVVVNPAPILIAYGMGTVAGIVVATPGGSGAYEALMVSFLALAGLAQGTAIAGTVLARVIILVVILALGYVFYQHALVRYGKKPRAEV